MSVLNREREALLSSLTTTQFAKAMAQLDLSAVAPENRKAAVMDHLMTIVASSIHDRDRAAELRAARDFMRRTRPTGSAIRRPKIIL